VEIGDRGEVAGKLLADAGADVTKVEPLQGAQSRRAGPFAGDRPSTNASLTYAFWNTNKRGITLDLSKPDAVEAWRRLVAISDVVLDSHGPDFLESLGAGWSHFASHERLIWCSITPFGLDGPWRDFHANDLVNIALGGPMMSTGYDDHDLPPIRGDGGQSLAIVGEYAVIGVLSALLQRRSSGRGQLIDVSIHETVSATTEGAFANWEYFQRISERLTGRHAAPSSPAPTPKWQIQCADGNYVVLIGAGMPRDERVWANLMAWMAETGADEPLRHLEFRALPRRQEDRQAIVDIIQAFISSMPAEEVYRRAQECHLPFGYVRRPEQNLDDPHWHDRGFFLKGEVTGYAGEVLYPGAPYRFSETPLELNRRAPLLGEHNFEVIVQELGFSQEQLLALVQAGAV
jgi:crotonobetainyl-CoA:carnitine CoA-transferase CaiB-like acyl-CoA transferase